MHKQGVAVNLKLNCHGFLIKYKAINLHVFLKEFKRTIPCFCFKQAMDLRK